MKKTIYYCDYCGKRTSKVFDVRTIWEKVTIILSLYRADSQLIRGEGCKECYESYQQWKKSRKLLKNKLISK